MAEGYACAVQDCCAASVAQAGGRCDQPTPEARLQQLQSWGVSVSGASISQQAVRDRTVPGALVAIMQVRGFCQSEGVGSADGRYQLKSISKLGGAGKAMNAAEPLVSDCWPLLPGILSS